MSEEINVKASCQHCMGIGREPDRIIPGRHRQIPCWFTWQLTHFADRTTIRQLDELTTSPHGRVVFLEARKPIAKAPAILVVHQPGQAQPIEIEPSDVLVTHDDHQLEPDSIIELYLSMAAPRDA